MHKFITSSLCLLAIALGACSDSTPSTGVSDSASSSQQGTNPTQPPAASTWVLASAPAEAMSVTQAKSSASEGDTIAVRARIGGRMEPITGDSAVFTVMDLAIPSCAELEDDHCRTPWDYCCETPETIRANAATVQLVDESGAPIDIDPTTELDALDEIIIVGMVAPRPSPDVLTIKARGIYVVEN